MSMKGHNKAKTGDRSGSDKNEDIEVLYGCKKYGWD